LARTAGMANAGPILVVSSNASGASVRASGEGQGEAGGRNEG
jgi:hypothetical protein